MPDEHLCDGYLKLMTGDTDFLKGESQDELYSGLIALLSFDIGSESDFDEEETREDAQQDIEEQFGSNGSVSQPLTQSTRSSVRDSKPDEVKVRQQEGCRFSVEKTLDASSPVLFQAYCAALFGDPTKRQEFPSAFIYVRKSTGGAMRGTGTGPQSARTTSHVPAATRGSGTYLTLQFNKVNIVEYSVDINGGSPPKETIGFSYGACRMTYYRQKADGTLDPAAPRPGWDFLGKPPGML